MSGIGMLRSVFLQLQLYLISSPHPTKKIDDDNTNVTCTMVPQNSTPGSPTVPNQH